MIPCFWDPSPKCSRRAPKREAVIVESGGVRCGRVFASLQCPPLVSGAARMCLTFVRTLFMGAYRVRLGDVGSGHSTLGTHSSRGSRLSGKKVRTQITNLHFTIISPSDLPLPPGARGGAIIYADWLTSGPGWSNLARFAFSPGWPGWAL